MLNSEFFIGQFQTNLIEGHRFALKLDFRQYKNFTQEERIHQHMYAIFLLLGTVESSRQQLNHKIDQILEQSKVSYASFTNTSKSLCDESKTYLLEFKQILKDIGKYRINEIFKSKQLFKVISSSLQYLVFRDDPADLNIRGLLKKIETLFELNYDVEKTYCYRYIKLNTKEVFYADKVYNLMIEQALDEKRIGTGLVYYVCKTDEAHYNGEKIQFMYSSYDDLLKTRQSVLEIGDPKSDGEDDENSWQDSEYDISDIINSESNSFDDEIDQIVASSQMMDDEHSLKKFKEKIRNEESQDEIYESEMEEMQSEIEDDGTAKVNPINIFPAEAYWNIENSHFLSLDSLRIEKERPKIQIIAQDNKNVNVIIEFTYKYPLKTVKEISSQNFNPQSDSMEHQKSFQLKLKTLQSANDETVENGFDLKNKMTGNNFLRENQEKKTQLLQKNGKNRKGKKTLIKIVNGDISIG